MRNSVIKKNRKVYIFKHQQTSSGGGGGGADLEDNKTATIDVSTYTEPVEITPTAGKDGMKKTTVTLNNIPSGGMPNLYAYQGSLTVYYVANNPPQAGDIAIQLNNESYLEAAAMYVTASYEENGVQTVELAFVGDSEPSDTATKINPYQDGTFKPLIWE